MVWAGFKEGRSCVIGGGDDRQWAWTVGRQAWLSGSGRGLEWAWSDGIVGVAYIGGGAC